MLNIATFNIFWYPESEVAQNKRNKTDEQRIARVLGNLAPHVVVFQEILDLERLKRLVEQAGGGFRLRSPAGDWLASSAYSMNIACAYDANVLDLVAGARLYDPASSRRFNGRRYPFALHLRHRASGWEFTVVGIHCKSGGLYGDPPADQKRAKEVEHLAGWLTGEPDTGTGHFEHPPTPDVIVVGDFNALRDHGSLNRLREGTLQSWYWPAPEVVSSLSGEEPHPVVEDPNEHWTTYLDREVIDHAISSPGVEARLIGRPHVYAFDLDPVMDDYPSADGHWLRRKTSYRAKRYGGAGLTTVENLYRISDHRPLRVSLEPG
jgi:endonuclease/exonuclease/phosphatase family metal-dependent hydrolase